MIQGHHGTASESEPGRGQKFSPHDHSRRIEKLRLTIDESEAGHLLISRTVNLRYLIGFTGSYGYLLAGAERLCFITDGRYDEQCRDELESAGVDADVRIIGSDGLGATLLDIAVEEKIERLGLEAGGITWAGAREIQGWLEGREVVPTSEIVEGLRITKDDSEIERMAAAARIGDEAFEYIIDRIEPGLTELEVATALERHMIDAGASSTSFDSIVAAGPRGAMPHAQPGNTELASGEMIVLDFGCIVDGYCSDMTRTVALGTPPSRLDRVYSEVQEAQARGVSDTTSGVATGEVDAACRRPITEAGYGENFNHSTGHGVGLEVHEAPRVARDGADILAAGHVVTVEPGIYLPGEGGVRIEDMVAVTEGAPLVLTKSPKELIVL